VLTPVFMRKEPATMGMKLRNWLHQGCFAVMLPLFAQAKTEKRNTQPQGSKAGEMFSDLIGTWWIWAGLILLIGLIGLLVYVRNKAPEDDD
jgi:hypothetical protein